MEIILYGKEPSDLVKSVDRAIDILDVLSNNSHPIGITEISNSLGLAKSTVSRITTTLLYRGLVKQEEKTKKYSLGIKLLEFGREYINDLKLVDEVRPFLEDLVKQINETGHFVIEDQGEVVYIDKVESTHSLRQFSRIGRRAPMHCTSVGKAILAYKSTQQIESIIKDKGLKKYTSNTITNFEKLKKELNEVYVNGYAVDDEEIQEYLTCIGVPIFNYKNQEVVGAISISGPKARMSEIEKLAEMLKETTKKISSKIMIKF